ncbi:beta-galactosidase [Halosimplex salinum]|uniref:beta-galactosidase n=1 Tax=Halosimplex salinum TaxID=1710538 RepID=UPI000F47E9FE|nr:beta-galactosidase [Halosimplex salinum]
MNIGVCYFPEHWPRESWAEQVAQMAEAGIEYVRMGEFAWSRYEPERGTYELDWLESAVDLVDEHGMQAVLCTPTATPPKWLVDEHPSILRQERDGTTVEFGSRRHYCFNSAVYRRESARIVERLAERFAGHDAVAGWQTDNEYGCHGTTRCYCDDCATAFRTWLRERYDGIDDLNDSWGNAFWSQEYTGFAEIDPPRHTATGHHPARLLDYYRFSSDSVVEFNREQCEILRETDDSWFVTHNEMSLFGAIDAYDLGADLDFMSWDSYPTGHVQHAPGETTPDQLRAGDPDLTGLNHAIFRDSADGDFWILEQQPGGVNWPPHPTQPGDGAMALWAHHASASGADTVSYFRWQRCDMGQEQYHAGLRNQDGSPDRGYHDAVRAAEDLERLAEPMDDSDNEARVALLHDYENLWGLQIEPASVDFDYWDHLLTYYAALRRHGVAVDVLPTDADLSEYDAVVGPTLYFADEDLAERLDAFARDGGEVLVTVRSGVKNEHNRLRPALPGPLSDAVGATVEQYEGFRDDAEPEIAYSGESYAFRTWGEWLDADATETVALHETGPAAGTSAITRNAVGEGHVTYVGVWPEDDLADALVTDFLDDAGIAVTDRLPDGVRLSRRGGLTWVCNFTSDPLGVDTPATAAWHLGDGTVDPFDVAVTDADPAAVSVVVK